MLNPQCNLSMEENVPQEKYQSKTTFAGGKVVSRFYYIWLKVKIITVHINNLCMYDRLLIRQNPYGAYNYGKKLKQ